MMDDSLCLGAIILERDDVYFTLFKNFRKSNYLHPSSHFTGTIESILSSCITICFGNCTASDHNTLQWIVRAAEKVIGVPPLSLQDIYHQHCIRRACSILKEKKKTLHIPFIHFAVLLSGRWFHSIRLCTSRLCNNFI